MLPWLLTLLPIALRLTVEATLWTRLLPPLRCRAKANVERSDLVLVALLSLLVLELIKFKLPHNGDHGALAQELLAAFCLLTPALDIDEENFLTFRTVLILSNRFVHCKTELTHLPAVLQEAAFRITRQVAEKDALIDLQHRSLPLSM